MYDWGKPLNIVMKKVYAYDKLHTDVDIQCTANDIYVKTETIKDMMYLQVLILMISYTFSVPINYRYYFRVRT